MAVLIVIQTLGPSVQPANAQGTLFYDDFTGNSLSSGWLVETHGSVGSYSLSNSILTLSTFVVDPTALVTVYRAFAPFGDDFTLSARVRAQELGGFAMRIHSGASPSLILYVGAQLEFDTVEKNFVASWYNSSFRWVWETFYIPSVTGTWFVLEMKVNRMPLKKITFNVYSDSGSLLGSFDATNLGLNYSGINYICLESWAGPFAYDVDWIKIIGVHPPSLTISLNTPTTYTGFKVDISGKLTYNKTGIPAADLLLSYSVTGGQTWNDITSVMTSSDGSYFAQWIPTATGNYLVRAEWNGNASLRLSRLEANSTLAVTQLEEKYVFSVVSNSAVSELAFNSTSRILSFTVNGPSGTASYTNVTIAKSLIGDISELKIYLDGNQISYNTVSAGDSWLLNFLYQHSTHKVVMSLGALPKPFIETPLGLAIVGGAVLAAIAMISIVLKRKQRPLPLQPSQPSGL